MSELLPEPPQWALDAGIPYPLVGEGFTAYVTRLGLDSEALLEELNERTMCLANLRLATALQRSLPHYFDQHVDAMSRGALGVEGQKRVERIADFIWGCNARRPARDVSLLPS